jgi:hypothetical protein
LKQKILLANEDLSLENPVDLQVFEEIKIIRSKIKKQNQDWFRDFKKNHNREPEPHE